MEISVKPLQKPPRIHLLFVFFVELVVQFLHLLFLTIFAVHLRSQTVFNSTSFSLDACIGRSHFVLLAATKNDETILVKHWKQNMQHHI